MEGITTCFIDIETSPVIGATWRTYDTNVLWIEQDTHIICFSAKTQDEHITKGLPDYRGYKKGWSKLDDRKLVRELWGILNRADIVVAHNGDRFDIKKMNARFMAHGMTPPAPYASVDTYKAVKAVSSNDSAKLDELGRLYGVGRKLEHEGIDLWRKCLDGDKESWKRMREYNEQDVILLERVYHHILPWIKSHPNIGMYLDGTCCSRCGGRQLRSMGWRRNATTKYRRLVCLDCGAWNRTTKSEQEVKPLVGI